MTDLDAILANVNSDDHASRLVAADALAENGRADEEEMLRDLEWPVVIASQMVGILPARVVRLAVPADRVPEGRRVWARKELIREIGGHKLIFSDLAACHAGPIKSAVGEFAFVRYGQNAYHEPFVEQGVMRFDRDYGTGRLPPEYRRLMHMLPSWEVPQSLREDPVVSEGLRPGEWKQVAGCFDGNYGHHPCWCERRPWEELNLRRETVVMQRRSARWTLALDYPVNISRFRADYLIGQCPRCDTIYWAHAKVPVMTYKTVSRGR